ncbi:MAG: O-succinylbenzoate synthase [Actinomycetia bacterium]|nr:O-succinylbenzoate synthase [Actinomycetes bacterium]
MTGPALIEHPIRIRLRGSMRSKSAWDGLLIEGPAGWGESSIFPDYPCPEEYSYAAALEGANDPWPAAVRTSIPVNALVSEGPFDPASVVGFPCVKVKVGYEGDVDRVAEVRDAIGPHVALRVDSNGVWDLDTAVTKLRAMAKYDLEFAEQPVESLADLARLHSRVDVPLAADECISSLNDVCTLARRDAADLLVIKVQRCGGVRPAMAWAEAADMPVVVTSMLETSVGIAAGVALAAALPELHYACGLGTASLLMDDVTSEPLVPVDGAITVRAVVPTAEHLARLAR